MTPIGDSSADLSPTETGYVRLIRDDAPQQPPLWLPKLVLTAGSENPAPNIESMRTPQTIDTFVTFITRFLEQPGAERPLDESPVVLRVPEVMALYQLLHELEFVYAGTSLGDLTQQVRSLLSDRVLSCGDAFEAATARSVEMPLSTTQLRPETSLGGFWRVDDATGRPVGLISNNGPYSSLTMRRRCPAAPMTPATSNASDVVSHTRLTGTTARYKKQWQVWKSTCSPEGSSYYTKAPSVSRPRWLPGAVMLR